MPHDQSPLTHDELRQFTGDLERYRHGFNRRVIYTPGVKHLAERAGAYWLIAAIASYFGTSKMQRAQEADPRLQSLQFWKLWVDADSRASLICQADSGEPAAIIQAIPYTDFPLDHIEIWAGFDGEHWALYLPSEH